MKLVGTLVAAMTLCMAAQIQTQAEEIIFAKYEWKNPQSVHPRLRLPGPPVRKETGSLVTLKPVVVEASPYDSFRDIAVRYEVTKEPRGLWAGVNYDSYIGFPGMKERQDTVLLSARAKGDFKFGVIIAAESPISSIGPTEDVMLLGLGLRIERNPFKVWKR